MTLGQLLGFSEQHDFWGSYTEVGGLCPGFPVSLFTFLHDGLGAPQGETKPVPDTSQLCDLNQVILLFESVSLWRKKKMEMQLSPRLTWSICSVTLREMMNKKISLTMGSLIQTNNTETMLFQDLL